MTLQQQRFVSAMVGEAQANATEACRLAGYKGNANTLGVIGFQNLRKPKIALAIKEAEAKMERRGIAIKQTRIDAKVHRWFILEAVRLARIEAFATQVEEDAVSPSHRRRAIPPGWESGLHVRQVKALPNGRGGSEIVEEFALDTAMMRELDTLEKDIAHELGDIEPQRVNVNHGGKVDHDHRHFDLSAFQPDEAKDLYELVRRYDAGDGVG